MANSSIRYPTASISDLENTEIVTLSNSIIIDQPDSTRKTTFASILSSLGIMRCIFFSKGGALESQKDTAFCEEDGKLYIWNGPYPKLIEAGSTPETSGGVGPGAWISNKDTPFVRVWKYRAVADGETTIQLPKDIPIVDVQTIYVQGLRQDLNEGFTYNAADSTIILADGLDVGDLVTVIIDVDPDSNKDIFAALKGTDGASNVGTSSGGSVQDVLDNLLLKNQQLIDKLASNNGASNIGTLDGITVEDALSNNAANIREHWRRQLSDAGLNLVDGSFEEGATANSATDAVWHIAGGQCYTWDGALPKAVPADSTPTTGGIASGAWVSVGDASLRSALASEKGALHIGNFVSSSGVISAKLYGVVSGVDCASVIQDMQDLSEELRLPIDFSGIEEVTFSGMIRVGDFFHWKSNGRFNTTIKPLTLTRTALGAAYSGSYGSVYAWFARKNPATEVTFARLENIGFDGQYQGGYSTPTENLIRAFCWHSDGEGNISRDIEANGCHFKNCPHEAWEGYTTGGGKIDGIRYINCSSEGTDPTVTAAGFNAFKCMNGVIDAPGPYGTYTIKNIVCRNSTAKGHRTLADFKRGCEHWIIDGCQTYDMNDCHHSTDGSRYGVFTASNEGVQTGVSRATKNYLEVQGEHITIEGFRYSASPSGQAGLAGLFVTEYKYPSETYYHQSLYINILSASIERVNNSAIRLVNTSHCTVDGVWAKFCNGAAVSWERVFGEIDGTTLAEIVPTDNTQGSAVSYDNYYDLNVAIGHNVTLSGVVSNNNGKTKVHRESITFHGNKPYSVVKPNYLNYDRLLKNITSTAPAKTDSDSWPLGTGYAFTLDDTNSASIQSLSVATIPASTKGWVYLDLYVLRGSSNVASVIFRELDSSGAALVNTFRPLAPNTSWELKSLIYAVTKDNCAAVEILLAPAAASGADSALTGTTSFSDIRISDYPI